MGQLPAIYSTQNHQTPGSWCWILKRSWNALFYLSTRDSSSPFPEIFTARNPFLETITIFIVLESKSEKGVFNLLSKKAKAGAAGALFVFCGCMWGGGYEAMDSGEGRYSILYSVFWRKQIKFYIHFMTSSCWRSKIEETCISVVTVLVREWCLLGSAWRWLTLCDILWRFRLVRWRLHRSPSPFARQRWRSTLQRLHSQLPSRRDLGGHQDIKISSSVASVVCDCFPWNGGNELHPAHPA